ncbi:OB-fold domain-containing protein [Nocardioides zeae]|uniref:OB-fold domain-containing protein n=1 Tax=Nocardioides imazamoxiresistens TaxID=3231893 RepID=A0ABU3PWP9_9ACTN|nr:OB-fold domain-containing protein [Nocardioides zeae]MDT9593262.1 OB-fold domain-containing protein [Nocardioides zeae]
MSTTQAPAPTLTGSRCSECSNVAYPAAVGCQRCGAAAMVDLPLSAGGRVWGWTVQRFPPKSPPYVAPAEGFTPFAVGYVELPEGVKVQGILDPGPEAFSALTGAQVRLVSTSPVPRFALEVTTGVRS